MNHYASPEFWSNYRALPSSVQDLADKAFELLNNNPRHPSLHFKKVARYWSARIGLKHRAIGVEISDGILWFWIGTHAEYDKFFP